MPSKPRMRSLAGFAEGVEIDLQIPLSGCKGIVAEEKLQGT